MWPPNSPSVRCEVQSRQQHTTLNALGFSTQHTYFTPMASRARSRLLQLAMLCLRDVTRAFFPNRAGKLKGCDGESPRLKKPSLTLDSKLDDSASLPTEVRGGVFTTGLIFSTDLKIKESVRLSINLWPLLTTHHGAGGRGTSEYELASGTIDEILTWEQHEAVGVRSRRQKTSFSGGGDGHVSRTPGCRGKAGIE